MTRISASLSLLAFALLTPFTAGCFEETKGAAGGEDTATDGSDGADGTDGADGSDGTDGTDGTDGADGTDGGGDTGPDPVFAQVRFLNLAPGVATFTLVNPAGEETVLTQPLGAEQGSAYADVPAGDLLLTVSLDGVVLIESYSVGLGEGAATTLFLDHGVTSIGVHPDDAEGVGAEQTRIYAYNDVNATDVNLFYMAWNGEGYAVEANAVVAYTATTELLVNTPTDRDQLELWWPNSFDGLLLDWEISDDMRAAGGSYLSTYFWTEGDCTFLNSACVPRLVTQRPDGTVHSYTLAAGEFGWTN